MDRTSRHEGSITLAQHYAMNSRLKGSQAGGAGSAHVRAGSLKVQGKCNTTRDHEIDGGKTKVAGIISVGSEHIIVCCLSTISSAENCRPAPSHGCRTHS